MQPIQETDLTGLLNAARSGDAIAREILIERYTPFVLGVVSRTVGRYVRLGEDDETSVGLLAFNEAITNYDASRAAGFLSFAETAIRRRVIDHLRKQSSSSQEIPFSALVSSDQDDRGQELAEDAQNRASVHEFFIRTEEEERRDEIFRYSLILREYGMSFRELARICPRHEDARLNAIRAAKEVARDRSLRDFLRHRRELPLRELEKRVSVSRKTLERQRKYIIAVALIFIEGFEHLREYVEK